MLHILCTRRFFFVLLYMDKKTIKASHVHFCRVSNFSVAQMVQFSFERVENIVGKGENAGYQHFLLFPQCFQKVFANGASKAIIVLVQG